MPAPYAVEPRDYKVGDTVRRIYNGRDKSIYVGVVVRVDTASDKVDVEFPMGVQRCAPEELIKVNEKISPPHQKVETPEEQVHSSIKRIAESAQIKLSEIEEAAESLLRAGYSEIDAVKLLADNFNHSASEEQLHRTARKVYSSAYDVNDKFNKLCERRGMTPQQMKAHMAKKYETFCTACDSTMVFTSINASQDALVCPECLVIAEF